MRKMLLMFEESTLERYRSTLRKCGSICTVMSVIACFIVIVIFLAILAIDFTKKIHIVYIEPTEPISVVSDKFLSIALDTSVIANGFKHLNLTDRKMLKVVKALSPAYLRIGGTMADRLIFTKSQLNSFKHYLKGELDGGECSYERKFCDFLQKPNFTMSSREWLQLNKLARETNMEIIFDLNALRRFDNGTWDYRNAEELISFSNEHNLEVNWELGNEPNSFRREFNYDVDPRQLGRDFHTLSNILKKYPKYAKSLLVGPDTTRPEIGHNESEIYLKKFLVDGGDVIDAVTWHHYYFNGATAKIADFLNPKNFDILKWQIVTVKEIVEHDKLTNKPIWLGETSSAYGGGAPHLSNRFIASFLWLDKLGLAAKYGLGVVIRQSIIQGYYALIGYNYNPTPDWWVSILYKKLVGNKVVDCHMPQSNKVRLYCHCTKNQSDFENTPSITVFGVNINNHKARIRFEGVAPLNSEEAKNLTVDAYVLTTVERIDSRYIFLNNELLTLTKTNDVPILQPKIEKANPYVVMPPYSLAFWVVPTGNLLPFC